MRSRLSDPLPIGAGATLKNRLVLAPLTNLQSHPDGRLSEDEFRWLTYRAEGGFALTMTCAAHVQAVGQGFPGQLGVWSDDHLEGLTRLADAIRGHGSMPAVQLHHAGIRSPKDLVGQPVGPSDDTETGARALTTREVEQLRDDFIAAARRAERAGFDGVEVHGAHGYILAQFISPGVNQRTDRYGGSLENRSRLVVEILEGIRSACRPGFVLGLRLSPERFGLRLEEIVSLARTLMARGLIDYLDMSLWDVTKEPEEEAFRGRTLMSYFTELDRGRTRLGVAGKITTAARAQAMLDQGADFVLIGRAAILHHDFAACAIADPGFEQRALPATRSYLEAERLGPDFIGYMQSWRGFVADDE